MKINTLNKMKIKDNHKIREIENYLDQEISSILDKKKYSKDYNFAEDNENESYRPNYGIKSLYRPLESSRKEQYLPFDKEQIRPILRDDGHSHNNSVANLILDTLQPMIEGWLDDNLERIVHRVVKRHLAKKNLLETPSKNLQEEPYTNDYSNGENPYKNYAFNYEVDRSYNERKYDNRPTNNPQNNLNQRSNNYREDNRDYKSPRTEKPPYRKTPRR